MRRRLAIADRRLREDFLLRNFDKRTGRLIVIGWYSILASQTPDFRFTQLHHLDLEPEAVHRMYEGHWEIEVVMRYYKSACQFDETHVHGDYSVIGSEFCDFLSTILTFRLTKEFDRHGLIKKNNYSRLLHLLRRAKNARVNGGEWQMMQTSPFVEELIEKLEVPAGA